MTEEIETPVVAALETHVSETLIIHGATESNVRGFVAEHNRRYHAGEPGGPDGNAAYLIKSAAFYETADAYWAGEESLGDIDISDLQ